MSKQQNYNLQYDTARQEFNKWEITLEELVKKYEDTKILKTK